MVTESTPTQETPCPSQEKLATALRMFTDLGVDVAYTEVDIRMNTPSNAQKLQVHAEAFGRMMGACMEVERRSLPRVILDSAREKCFPVLTRCLVRLCWVYGLGG